jgi:hypothetical protein
MMVALELREDHSSSLMNHSAGFSLSFAQGQENPQLRSQIQQAGTELE